MSKTITRLNQLLIHGGIELEPEFKWIASNNIDEMSSTDDFYGYIQKLE